MRIPGEKFNSQSGQVMIPILMTLGSILLLWSLSNQGITQNAVSQKDASIVAESDAFATSISAVINVEQSCSQIIQYGDGGNTLYFDILQQPVVTFTNGLYFPTGATGLSSPQAFIASGTYSNTVKIPNIAVSPSALRIDPTGYVNYGLQNSGPFASPTPLNCYQVNLHVEPVYPTAVTGAQSGQLNFPMQIGVVPGTHQIKQCVGGTSFCVMATPSVSPSPISSCLGAGTNFALNWTASNTSYVELVGPYANSYPTPQPSAGPAYVQAPWTPGNYIYYAIPYDGLNQPAPSPWPSWVFVVPSPPVMVTASVNQVNTSTVQAAWISQNAASVTINPAPAPSSALQGPVGVLDFTNPGYSTSYTFTAAPLCGTASSYPLTVPFTYVSSGSSCAPSGTVLWTDTCDFNNNDPGCVTGPADCTLNYSSGVTPASLASECCSGAATDQSGSGLCGCQGAAGCGWQSGTPSQIVCQ